MKTFMLAFDDGNGDELDLGRFVEALDAGAQIWTLDGHVCFVRSGLRVDEITDRFLGMAGSRLFVIADVSASAYSGRMVGEFWEFFKGRKVLSAAE
ncbi:MAG: hypothetical protein KGQ28_03555 [Hyphomicrobiales bacterium]|nr:hypothetical protein [Hyphomicrobiales bacterium]